MNINLTFINSTFVNLENLNRDSWILLGKVISCGSVMINGLAIYLIVMKSKKETRPYKICTVVSHVLLCLAQFIWGVLTCVVPLLPFPAFIFYGYLANSVDVIILTQVWILTLISFLWALFATFVIRYRMVSSNTTKGVNWIVSATVSYIICVTTIIIIFEILRAPEEEIKTFIAWKYPKYSNLFNNHNLLVFSDKRVLHISAFSAFAIAGALFMCYVSLSFSIYVEVRKKVNSFSSQLQRHHMKVLYDIILRIVIKFVTLILFPTFTLSLYFVTPEFNAIGATMVFYNIFVAAPIPGTVALLIRTPAYKRCILEWFVKIKLAKPILIMNNRITS